MEMFNSFDGEREHQPKREERGEEEEEGEGEEKGVSKEEVRTEREGEREGGEGGREGGRERRERLAVSLAALYVQHLSVVLVRSFEKKWDSFGLSLKSGISLSLSDSLPLPSLSLFHTLSFSAFQKKSFLITYDNYHPFIFVSLSFPLLSLSEGPVSFWRPLPPPGFKCVGDILERSLRPFPSLSSLALKVGCVRGERREM